MKDLLKRLSFRTKTFLAFSLIASMVVLVGVVGIHSTQTVHRAVLVLVNGSTPRMMTLLELQLATFDLEQGAAGFNEKERGSSRARTPELAAEKYELLAHMEKLNKHIREYERLSRGPHRSPGLERLTEAKDSMLEEALGLIEMKERSETVAKVPAQYIRMKDAWENLRAAVEAEVSAERVLSEAQRLDAISAVKSAERLGMGLTLLALLLSFGLASAFTRLVTQTLELLKDAVESVGRGELDTRISTDSADKEIGTLFRGFNEMAVSLKENIKARDQVQARMLQSEKMAAVGQLAAGVAHEINNPLGVILGFAQSMAGQLQAADGLELPVRSIEREALRCKALVQNLLTFARTSTSDRVPMDLNLAIEQALVLIMPQAKINRVAVSTQLAKGLPPVLGNKNQLEQVIMNLAKNAIDAMPNGGALTLSTELFEQAPNSWIGLNFIDDGTGIPSSLMSKIFDPFFTTKPLGQGTGLGLSLVSEIVQKHSGEVSVESRPGRTAFTVKLPVRTGQELDDRIEALHRDRRAELAGEAERKGSISHG